jgi:hypothetical protein
MRFLRQFGVFDTENDIENACDVETHIQTAHPKCKCNQPLTDYMSLRAFRDIITVLGLLPRTKSMVKMIVVAEEVPT